MSWLTSSRIWLSRELSQLAGIDPEGLRNLTTITVKAHWFVLAICLIEMLYRPYYGYASVRFAYYTVAVLILGGVNGYIHYRLRSNSPPTLHWLVSLYALDLLLVSGGLAVSGGFSHYFLHLFYYPTLGLFAVIIASFWLNVIWVTLQLLST